MVYILIFGILLLLDSKFVYYILNVIYLLCYFCLFFFRDFGLIIVIVLLVDVIVVLFGYLKMWNFL